jgi:putative endonuclease
MGTSRGVIEGFSKRHGLKRLVYAEWHEEVTDAIHREKRIKHWPRDWKINLIERENPRWEDISETMT